MKDSAHSTTWSASTQVWRNGCLEVPSTSNDSTAILGITHVLVDYTFYPSTPHPYFAQAFEEYTGLRLKAINLFDGDLQTEIELPR